ncbi:uncharacterized protein MYCGRDRAFT_82625 [Zymoseptoria tritici IPO323]|uniref:Uncharacterized protein n=1 Tax=Zymoseptoria tritici (strain CBS 115943 / IPO323) TaxID=336722 RepID=F9XN98_ZYMTI|nr:uncharacterized protein MYCGRDRAFT_82625 [Zymoseptoria tritici IPO323]EGP83376.1 hypothetical protein MYCGRDRAFT_82625 [Zymoseptoria tritici IPO323]
MKIKVEYRCRAVTPDGSQAVGAVECVEEGDAKRAARRARRVARVSKRRTTQSYRSQTNEWEQ